MSALDGKVAIVTGAGRGIGRGEAIALAREGAAVVVNDVGGAPSGDGSDATPAQEVVAEIESLGGRALADRTDVTDFDGVAQMIQRTVEEFGRLDIVVNNAGILRDRMITSMTEEDFDLVVGVHLKGHFNTTRHALAYWREQSKAGETVDARIVNTASSSGLLGNIGQGNYGPAKAGIAALTQIAAMESVRYGVTVNALCPTARTRLTEGLLGDEGAPEGWDHFGPDNVAPLVVALCDPRSSAISGHVFGVFGGLVQRYESWSLGQVVMREQPGPWGHDELVGRLGELFPKGDERWESPGQELFAVMNDAVAQWGAA